MRKILFALCILIPISAYAASPSCTDLSTSFSRGAESKSVLSLQNFLFAKGILKVVPNGYFGPSTFAAVKTYQKMQGLSQVGTVGPATRAAIKKESCISSPVQAFAPPVQTASSSNQTVTVQTPVALRPSIESFDPVSLFAGGTANWNFSMHGSNFSTSSNVITFRNTETRKIYTIGTLPTSATGTIMFPNNLTGTAYTCGTECLEKMEAGTYEVTVTTTGGTSDPKYLTILPFVMSAQTTAINTIPASATGVQLGTFSFSTSQAVVVKTVSFTIGTSTISAGGLGNVILTDQLTGQFITSGTELYAIQSGLVGVYANTSNSISGTVYGTFSATIQDYIGNHETSFVSRPILVTVAGVI